MSGGARPASVERLLAASTPQAEALALFASARATSEEGRVIDRLLERHLRIPLPEPLRLAVAVALVDRDEGGAAAQLLEGADSSAALVLLADVRERRGEPLAAVALVERVLLRDLDWPGARERRDRWLRAAGLAPSLRPPDPSGATLMTSAPEAPFRLARELGRGGSAAVYEAEDLELGRRVALKVYHRAERDRAQLLHEARVAVSLSGEGIVRVFDVDPHHGWLAMGLAPLGALRGRLDEPLEAWAPPLARALARVHAAGWVHLDVKPANVLLARPDRPVLTDFGTARRRGEPSPPGSLGFVSPERLAGRPSDPRDDVFGFGRVLEQAFERQAASPAWREIARACTGAEDGRPGDGADLVARLSSGSASDVVAAPR